MLAELRFYAELKEFLPPGRRRSGRVAHSFVVPGSVKDAIEACGVPHTEVDLILVNGRSVDFAHRLNDGDCISVYPVFEALDITPVVRLRPEPLRELSFVVDGHLSKLAHYLRLLGFDTLCDGAWSDHELVRISTHESRVLLTRDVGLLKHGALTHAAHVRSTAPREQIAEVVDRFHLSTQLRPFSRCMVCNGLLADVAKAEVVDRIPPGTAAAFDEFRCCASCARVYWRGAHHEALRAIVTAASGPAPASG